MFSWAFCVIFRIKNVPRLSTNVYEGLCGEIGTSTEVKFRRDVIDTTEDLLGNVLIEKKYDRFKWSGGCREGFRLKTSDIDIMRWCISDKVICNPSQICLYHYPYQTVILMECDDLPPGFTRLKLIVPGHHFNEISCCVEINDDQYISIYLFIQNTFRTLKSTYFDSISLHGPALCIEFASCTIDIVRCFKVISGQIQPYHGYRDVNNQVGRQKQKWHISLILVAMLYLLAVPLMKIWNGESHFQMPNKWLHIHLIIANLYVMVC